MNEIIFSRELQHYKNVVFHLQRQVRNKQKRMLEIARKNVKKFSMHLIVLRQQSRLLQQQIEDKRQQLQRADPPRVDEQQRRGLSPARIQQFQRFPADQMLAGDVCSVCLDDIEIGKMMQRLDCEGRHVFCQGCVEGWFVDHNTCPKCRHFFA